MTNLTKWSQPSAYAAANLADNAAMAGRGDGYFNIAQTGGADVAIDNSQARNLYMDVEILLGAAAWTAAGYIELYLLAALDGGNYESGSAAYLPSPANLAAVAQISTDTVAAARRLALRGIVIPPAKFKILWRWKAGVNSAASGNQMSFVTYANDNNG